MSTPTKLPIGIQAFEVLRQNGYLYVDKTRHIFNLVDQGMFYFLARPRRFGKSLLVSTLKCLFEGRRELFERLWIDQESEWGWKQHPVLTFDFNEISHRTPNELEERLLQRLKVYAEQFDFKLETSILKDSFHDLILAIHKKTGMPVVVLVDEYDKPIIDHLGRGTEAMEVAKANRDVLKQLFGTLKGGDVSSCLRFVFLTGVSKFSRVSVFSDLNNLNDITMHDRFSDLCGYTEAELEHNFPIHLEQFQQKYKETRASLLQQLAHQYNGYCFSKEGTSVYNPFSILKAFDELAFENYWFETGSPTFLVNLLKEEKFELPEVEHLEMEADDFNTYDLEDLDPVALLFQTGYVTIKKVEGRRYTLGYPNQEVRMAFLKSLFKAYTEIPKRKSKIQSLFHCLANEQFDDFFEIVEATFAAIPYTLCAKQDEAYFHTVFYLMLAASGVSARNEVLTCRGRIDMLVEFEEKVLIIEFKCNQSAEVALEQIHNKGYAAPFQQSGKNVVLMGVGFSTEQRNIAQWKVETL